MTTLLERLGQIDDEMKAERREELRQLFHGLHADIMNIPCDLSATAPEHHVGHKAGHKETRHRAAEMVCEAFSKVLD